VAAVASASLAASAFAGSLWLGGGSGAGCALRRCGGAHTRGSVAVGAAKGKAATKTPKAKNEATDREPQPWEDDYPRPPIKVFDDDFTDDKIEEFFQETISGNGGPPPPGPVEDIVTEYFTWDGRPRNGKYSADDRKVAFQTMKDQMRDQTWITYGGPRQETVDDKKGWVWLAAEMTVVGLCLQIYKSVPYGRRPLLVAKEKDVESMFEKVDWAKFEERLEVELGTLLREEPRPPESDDWRDKFRNGGMGY